MWESPVYKFKVDIGGKRETILIDVTGSAPNFSKPGKQLEGTFSELLKDLEPSKTKIPCPSTTKTSCSCGCVCKGVWPPGCNSNMRSAKFSAPSSLETSHRIETSFAPSISTGCLLTLLLLTYHLLSYHYL